MLFFSYAKHDASSGKETNKTKKKRTSNKTFNN